MATYAGFSGGDEDLAIKHFLVLFLLDFVASWKGKEKIFKFVCVQSNLFCRFGEIG